MAKMTFTGVEDVMLRLEARGVQVEGAVNHMLNAGAKVMIQEQQQAIEDLKLVDTGDMIKSVKPSKIKKDKEGVKIITVSPSGHDRKGVPNQTKAFKAQIGSSKKLARPWKTLAEERGYQKVQERMREVFNEEMEQGGKKK